MTFPAHGGDLHFGPDGYLYVPLGDEGTRVGAETSSQTIDRNFFGGILRIDVDGRPGNLPPNPHPAVRGGYWIPADNPWIGATSFNGRTVDPSQVRTEFWAIGLRNPHRICFEPGTGAIFTGDVGLAGWEEVNRVVRGGNYGWHWLEGPQITTRPGVPPQVNPSAFSPPYWSYPNLANPQPGTHPNFTGAAIIGGFVYEGSKYPNLNGKYLCGDFVSGHIWAITRGPVPVVERIAGHSGGLNSFALDPMTGDILVSSGGSWHRLVVNVSAQPPATLSATGVFADLATLTPVSAVHPYEVANPFWSDYALKSRWFFLPAGTTVQRDAQDHWAFPPGAFWVKHFELESDRGSGGRMPVETRFIVKTPDGAYGLTYRWRADRSDADLVEMSGADTHFAVTVDGQEDLQPWRFPSRQECLNCHNETAGWALGFSTRQLNVGDQLGRLVLEGRLTPGWAPGAMAGLPRLSRAEDESVSLGDRFKSYLDANCAYCHQPGGTGRGEWDGRFSVPLEASGIINGSVVGDLGIEGARVIKPQDASRSILFRRIADMNGHQLPSPHHMPPLATFQLNRGATNLISRYIESLEVAPEPVVRRVWQLGVDDDPAVLPYQPTREFSVQSGLKESPPGLVTRLPGDPEYSATANPSADDDYYFAGVYPVGFNGLSRELRVPQDEPWTAWERAHTIRDLTSRMHFVLDATQTGAGARCRLSLDWVSGGWMLNGVNQPGFGEHDLRVQFRNGSGFVTVLWTGRVTVATNLVLEFPATAVQATAGANTIEFTRTGPSPTGSSYWIQYDYVRLEALDGGGNTAPVLSGVADQAIDEQVPWSVQLTASDADLPAQVLSYSLVSGPSGLTVGAGGLVSWTPTEAQGPGEYEVTVQVRDNGEPPLGDMKGFRITVREVNMAPVLSGLADRAIDEQVPWSLQLTASDADLPAQVLSYSLVSGPSGLTVGAGGLVSWTPTGTQGPGEYEVTVRVSDSGVPPLSDSRTFRVTVHDAPPPPPEPVVRRVWQLGVDDDPAVLPYQPTREFSVQSGLKESPPGLVTRLPGDPEYSATANPSADDDYYFAGVYPVGFNGLSRELRVPQDEPWTAWERAHTIRDLTSRMHFVLDATQTGAGARCRLSLDWVSGGWMLNGVNQPGFGEHDLRVQFRNGSGFVTVLWTGRVTVATNLVLEFPAMAVRATAGANTIEFTRTGPSPTGTSCWIQYDYVRLEVPAHGPARPPVPEPPASEALDLGVMLADAPEELLLEFEHPLHAITNVQYRIESSPDLLRWTEVVAEPLEQEIHNGRIRVTMRHPLPPTESGIRFLRVRAVAPERATTGPSGD